MRLFSLSGRRLAVIIPPALDVVLQQHLIVVVRALFVAGNDVGGGEQLSAPAFLLERGAEAKPVDPGTAEAVVGAVVAAVEFAVAVDVEAVVVIDGFEIDAARDVRVLPADILFGDLFRVEHHDIEAGAAGRVVARVKIAVVVEREVAEVSRETADRTEDVAVEVAFDKDGRIGIIDVVVRGVDGDALTVLHVPVAAHQRQRQQIDQRQIVDVDDRLLRHRRFGRFRRRSCRFGRRRRSGRFGLRRGVVGDADVRERGRRRLLLLKDQKRADRCGEREQNDQNGRIAFFQGITAFRLGCS